MSRILTERLELWQMTGAFLTHCLEEDCANGTPDCDMIVPVEWQQETRFMTLRRDQYREDSEFASWGVWAVIERASREMVGHIGFHSAPDPEYLRPYAQSAVEFGFTVYPRHRGLGIAAEAARALMKWAQQERNQSRFILSISPMNGPSIAIARKLGFERISSWNDPEDGVEDVYQLDI